MLLQPLTGSGVGRLSIRRVRNGLQHGGYLILYDPWFVFGGDFQKLYSGLPDRFALDRIAHECPVLVVASPLIFDRKSRLAETMDYKEVKPFAVD